METVQPIIITDNKTGTTYTLDFSRDSILFAENRGFKPEEVTVYPVSKFPELFYYAFRMHHKNMARNQTDKLYERLGGFSEKFLTRLLELYNQAALSNNIVLDDEDMGKNGDMTVEF